MSRAAVRAKKLAEHSAPAVYDWSAYVKTVDGMLAVRNAVIARLSEHLTREEKLALGWPRTSA